MKDEVLFDDIKKKLKRDDRQRELHPLVPIILDLGIQKGTVTKYLTDEKVCCRATSYNLLNGAVPKISKDVEYQMLDILKRSMQQAITVSKNYRKWHSLRAIEQLNSGIIAGKKYLESLNEPIEIDFEGIGESLDIEGINDQSGWMSYIEHVG
jgi:hypothetical protein